MSWLCAPILHERTFAFKGLLTKAEPPTTIRFHDPRHTAASLALSNGPDIETTQEMLGHARAGTALNIYGHVPRERKRDAVSRAFGDVITGEVPD
jgi:integrase